MKVRISPVTGLDYLLFIFRAVISIGPGARARSVTRWSPLYHATDLQAMSLNYVFWLRFLQIDYVSLWNLAYRSPSWQYFEVYGLSALESNDRFTNAQCTPFLVSSSVVYPKYGYALIQLSWILLRLFSTSYMSILHTVHNGLVLHSSGLVLLSWHFPKHFCTGSTNTIVDFVKLVTTIPQRWSSIGSYPMGEFAFVIGSWNILSSTFYV